jgi:hypothetical protein
LQPSGDLGNTSGSVLYTLLREDDSVFATFEWIYGLDRFGVTGAGKIKINGRVDIDGSDIARVEFVATPVGPSGSSPFPTIQWIAMRPEGMLTNFRYYAFDGTVSGPTALKHLARFDNVFIPFDVADIPTGLRVMVTPSSPSPVEPRVDLIAERIYVEPVYEDLGCYYGSPYGDDVILTPAKREECPHPVGCGTFRDTYSTPRWTLGITPSYSFDALSLRRQKSFVGCVSGIGDVPYYPETFMNPETNGNFYNCSNPSSRTGIPLTALYSEWDAEFFTSKGITTTLSATASPQTWYVTTTLTITGVFWLLSGAPVETYVYGQLFGDQGAPAEVPTYLADPCGGLRSSGRVNLTYFPPTLPGVVDIMTTDLQRGSGAFTGTRNITWRKEVCRFKIPPEINYTSGDLLVTGSPDEMTTTQYLITKILFTDGVGMSNVQMRATLNTESITLDPSVMTLQIVADDETWLPQPFA